MTAALIAFATGVLALQLQPALPASGWLWLAPAGVLAAVWRRFLLVPCALILGFLWAAICAQRYLSDWLSPDLEGADLEVVGVVAALPAAMERGQRFEFDIESAPRKLPRRVLISWYRSPVVEAESPPSVRPEQTVHPGERWRLTVRLRRPHGQVNPHGFDYEAWLLERGIGATGYVRIRPPPLRLGRRSEFMDRVESAREAVRDRFASVLGATPAAGILTALAVGDQRSIANEEWRLFSRTGVTHLMSISGLHVTMISALCAWLVGALWRRVPALALWQPVRRAAAPAAILAAWGYALLAGFAVPAQRTCWMVSVVAIALWLGRIASPARTLALALAVVLFTDPWAVLAPGFWLSFGAVALIFLVAAAPPGEGPRATSVVRQALQVQWAITLGLAPATLLLFSHISLIGPAANAIAIPLISWLITPLALLAAVLPIDAPVHAAEALTSLLLQFLETCAGLPAALWQQHAPPLWAAILAIAGALWLIAPRGVPWRGCGLALMAPAFALAPPGPRPGQAWITTLDVGQGLAVVVRTASRTLVYDTGPQYAADADSGERIVAPYLRAMGTPQIDKLIVSHHDSDHAGGAASMVAHLDVAEMLSSLAATHPLHAIAPRSRPCEGGDRWEWDGVRFAMLHPARGESTARKANDLSCVLRLEAGGHAMLLTGDIEWPVEQALLARDRPALRAQALLVPHHGSRTSSTAEFIATVRPRIAVVAAGYRNRFGHPHPEVLRRYAGAGVRIWRTDLDGAVSLRLGAEGTSITGERSRSPRYWRQRREPGG